MAALQFPCTLFKTQNRVDDYGAKDMRCGDLTEAQLKSHYRLDYISDRVDPWTLTRRSSMDRPQSMFCCNLRGQGEKITRQQCAAMLFDEFRSLSRKFSLYGPYSHLIEKMITHMQHGNGTPFRDMSLDSAMKEQIVKDISERNSTRILLSKAFRTNIDWENNIIHLLKRQSCMKPYLVEGCQNSTDSRIIITAWVLPSMIPGQRISL